MKLLAPLLACLATAGVASAKAPPPPAPRFDAGVIAGLPARNIGSAEMSGRIAALAGYDGPDGKVVLFVGAASGGVWKSTDGGTTFRPVFDDQPVQSIGAIAVDPRDPKRVWVGTGESWTRNSTSVGDGIYLSVDGGESWKNVGLPESERISKIVVDPRSSDTVYACVPGKLWSDSPDRGVYRTRDGGKTWDLVLRGPNASTGCGGMTQDPDHPDILLASLWDFRRQGWTFRSGGDSPEAPSGSGLFRSADGGATWTEITAEANAGFAEKPFGRIAVAIAPSDPQRIYAFVESTASALFVSSDGGGTWTRGDDSQWMVWRPFYFANLVVDPTDADRVYKPDGAMIRSDDGGRSFSPIGGFVGMHGDVHDVWIDPANPAHVIAGDDGGLFHSFDGGNRWWKAYNLPISQFYHVAVDDRDPFEVYGGLQDNGSWVAPSEHPGGIGNAEWEPTCGWDGFWSFPDPSDDAFVYCEGQGGYAFRYNRKTAEARDIQPKPGPHEKLRWNWNTPMALSPNEPGTLYMGAQFLFRSRDHGQSWDRISPDLTTNDPTRQRQEQSGGVSVDNSAAEMYTTIFAVSESPKQPGLIWVGTDDGNVQLTRDDGRTWVDLTANIVGLPARSWVSSIQASAFDAGTAYATFDRHTDGDMAPWVYRTTDMGQHWEALVTPTEAKGIRGYAHVIREDPGKASLLYLGTEFGLWMSIDGGVQWARYTGSEFPAVAVRDIAVQERRDSLVLATHGRGLWILDDISAVRALTPEVLGKDTVLLTTSPVEQRLETWNGRVTGSASFIGSNPPQGAAITWYQRTRHLFGKLTIDVLGPDGEVVESLPASTHRGLNRVVWSMHLPPPPVPPAAQLAWYATSGVRVLPGAYTVRLTNDGQVFEAPLIVVPDARVGWSDADRKARFDAAMRIYGLFADETRLFEQITATRAQVADRRGRAGAPVEALDDFDALLDGIRKEIVATKEGGAITGEERLREHTDQLYGAVLSWEGPPAAYQLTAIDTLGLELSELRERFDGLMAAQREVLNATLNGAGLPAIEVPPETDAEPSGGGLLAPPGEPWERTSLEDFRPF